LPPVGTAKPPAVATKPPIVGPDWKTLFNTLVASLPRDQGFGTVTPAALSEELAQTPPFLLDAREVAEVEKDGYVEGSIHIPVREVLANLDKLPAPDQAIVVICASGDRGGMLMAALRLLGYTNVRNLDGGMTACKKANLPFVTGSMPAAPLAISTPVIADQELYDMLNGFFTNLPGDFYSIKTDKLNEALTGTTLPTLLDVRAKSERTKKGSIEGSINLPFNNFFEHLNKVPKDRNAPIVILDSTGHCGGIVMMALRLMGYTNVFDLTGGMNAWVAAELPVVK